MAIETSEDAVRELMRAELSDLAVGSGTEPTMTPGVFYHGSRHSDIVEFKSQADMKAGEGGRTGIYFTQIPTYAAQYSSFAGGGRIYAAELVTRNMFVAPPGEWAKAGAFGSDESENSLCEFISAEGYDCIATEARKGWALEMIVFDKSAIRLRETAGPVAPAPEIASGVFYFVDGMPGPDYAPDCVPLFSSRERAEMVAGGSLVRAAMMDARGPTYCDRDTWPRMNIDVLRYYHTDCLIDPNDGGALVTDRSRLVPMNRAMLRAQRRRPLLRRAPMIRAG